MQILLLKKGQTIRFTSVYINRLNRNVIRLSLRIWTNSECRYVHELHCKKVLTVLLCFNYFTWDRAGFTRIKAFSGWFIIKQYKNTVNKLGNMIHSLIIELSLLRLLLQSNKLEPINLTALHNAGQFPWYNSVKGIITSVQFCHGNFIICATLSREFSHLCNTVTSRS